MGSTYQVVRETVMKEKRVCVCVGETDRKTERETEARGLCDAYLLALDVWSISISTGF